MQDLELIEDVERAAALLKPARIEILRQLATETTCTEVGAALGQSPQRVYYHVKALERAGLVDRVGERRVRGTVEGIYRAKAQSYWLSPGLVGSVGGARAARDRASLGYLIGLAEEVQTEVGRLASRAGEREVPSLGIDAQIELADDETRARFMRDVQRLFSALAQKYGTTGDRNGRGTAYRVALACYPTETEETDV